MTNKTFITQLKFHYSTTWWSITQNKLIELRATQKNFPPPPKKRNHYQKINFSYSLNASSAQPQQATKLGGWQKTTPTTDKAMNRIKHAMNRRTYLKSRKLETWAQLNEPSKESKNDGEEEEDGDSDDGVWVLRANMHERAIESYEFVETLYEIGEKKCVKKERMGNWFDWRRKKWRIDVRQREPFYCNL